MSSETKVVGYARSSTQEQQSSIDDQEALIQRYCREQGYELLEVHKEKISGRTNILRQPADPYAADHSAQVFLDKRGALKDALYRGDAEKVIVKNPTRLARKLHYIGVIEETAGLSGRPVEYVQDQGSWLEHMMKSLLAEHEVRQTRRRTKDALDAKEERGEWRGRTPLGLATDINGKLVASQPEKQFKILLAARQHYLNTEDGYQATAQWATQKYGFHVSKQEVRSYVQADWQERKRYLARPERNILEDYLQGEQ